MKAKSFRFLALLLAAAVLMVFTGRAQAAPVDLLRRAYVTLAEADHDYKGHRADAMKQIEAAAKELGVKLRGDDKDHEKQGISDEHLREAEKLLNEAKGGLSGKALRHVDDAEKQLSIALRIK
jgi:ABC-type sugar transport system substrate-binding protein